MEGYLLALKNKSDFKSGINLSIFDFERIWVVLDRQELIHYENIDLVNQIEVKKIESLPIKNTRIEKLKFREFGVQYGLHLIDQCGRTLALYECGDPNLCFTWLVLLNKAANLHMDQTDFSEQRCLLCTELGIDPRVKLAREIIIKAYKRCARQAHPDKGGDLELFNRVNTAHLRLLDIQAREELWDSERAIRFDALLEMCGNGIGLGIDVLEDSSTAHVIVQHIDDRIKLHSISPEAGGFLKTGDVLVGIDNDDTSTWFLSRVHARLNSLRAPIGTRIRMTFKRLTSDIGVAAVKSDLSSDAAQSAEIIEGESAENTSNCSIEDPFSVPGLDHQPFNEHPSDLLTSMAPSDFLSVPATVDSDTERDTCTTTYDSDEEGFPTWTTCEPNVHENLFLLYDSIVAAFSQLFYTEVAPSARVDPARG